MKIADDDPTLNRVWLRDQMDRTLAFEILQKAIRSDFGAMDIETMSDRTGMNPGLCKRIIRKLQLIHK